MHGISAKTGDEAYARLLQLVNRWGKYGKPRGQHAAALYDVTVVIDEPAVAPPTAVRDKYAYRIAATETIQLLGGFSSLEQLDAASSGRFSRYANDGRLRGAYGPRLFHQLQRVEKQLRADADTRQAVAVLWRHDDDLDVNDVPCTVSLTFRVVDEKLELKVHMRSNDLILGVPYDWFMFSRVQISMAGVLGIPVGRYVHHVDNLHVYGRDVNRLHQLIQRGQEAEAAGVFGLDQQIGSLFLGQEGYTFNSWNDVQADAVLVARGVSVVTQRYPWYAYHVVPLAEDVITCSDCRYVFNRRELGATLVWCPACGPKHTTRA